jgi:hypothetical protein
MDSTTIANLALAKIGDQSILSLDDPSPEARFAKLFYGPTRDELLRLHQWNWATSMSRLSQVATPPEFSWKFAFALPSDFGRMITFNSYEASEPAALYQIHGKHLLTDEGTASIMYVRKMVDESLFDPLFIECLVLKLAAKLARPLAGSMDIEKQMNAYFEKTLSEARRIDGADGLPKRKLLWIDSDLVKARYSGVI